MILDKSPPKKSAGGYDTGSYKAILKASKLNLHFPNNCQMHNSAFLLRYNITGTLDKTNILLIKKVQL